MPADGLIRPLDAQADRAEVAGLYARAADYVLLETGAGPDDATLEDFFTGRPPGTGPEATFRDGLWSGGTLLGIAEYAFGYPNPLDGYIGLMLFDPGARGRGLGPQLLAHVAEVARTRQAPRLLIAVLDANPRGRAFWERQGFRLERSFPPALIGSRMHIRHRMVLPL